MFSLKKPKFWQTTNIISAMLLPISMVFLFLSKLRPLFNKEARFDTPIICIGNNVVGGTGKTPTVIALSKILKSLKYKPAIISKGYKGNVLSPVRVDQASHDFKDVGEEALLLAKAAPTYIAKQRKEAIELALKEGANLILLDDGLQDPSIRKDLSIVVFDNDYGIGNGYILPAGPLRETVSAVLRKTNKAIVMGDEKESDIKQDLENKGFEIINANICVSQPKKIDLKSSYIAFAGIGNPEKFYKTLNDLKINLIKTIDFPDHHSYTNSDLKGLIDLSDDLSAKLITTEKDFVKIPKTLSDKFLVLPIEVKFNNPNQINKIINNF